jgi:hypothetical protein
MVVDLLTLKARNVWLDTSFNQLLQLLENLIPSWFEKLSYVDYPCFWSEISWY